MAIARQFPAALPDSDPDGRLAHEFRNLLTAVLGNTELALLDAGDSPRLRYSLEQIQQCALRAVELTHLIAAGLPTSTARIRDSKPAAPVPISASGSPTVLIIDDEEAIREATRRILERSRYRVSCAATGEEGLDIVRSANPPIDAIVLDLTLPGMDGLETLHAIRQIAPEIRVVLWSGRSREDLEKRLNGIDSVVFLEKPSHFSGLQNALTLALGN